MTAAPTETRSRGRMSDGIDPVDVAVGERVRALRQACGLTQGQLGREVGVTFQQIQKYERGANRISASMLVRISRTLDAPLIALFPESLATPSAEAAPDLDLLPGGRNLADFYRRLSPSNRTLLVSMAAALAEAEADEGA
jgi:transcriptional regulator with XRE-family HTH domain